MIEGCYIISSEVAVCLRVPQGYCRICTRTARTHKSCDKILITLTWWSSYDEAKKCSFVSEIAAHLGHVICLRRPKIKMHAINAMKDLKSPINITEFCAFLELCDVLRGLMPSFAKIEALLNKKWVKSQPKVLGTLAVQELSATRKRQENWHFHHYSRHPTLKESSH